MIRLLRAFALLRWRLFLNGLRGRRRDALEQVSRISRLLVLAIVGVTFAPTAVMLAVFAFHGASARSGFVLFGAKAVLGLLTVVVVISPILRFGGSASSMSRLSLLPISRGMLWALEAAAQLADPWILAVVPALVALPAGIAVSGDLSRAAIAGAASLLALAYLVALGSLSSLGAALLLRNRRVAEITAVAVLLLVTAVSFVPLMTSSPADDRSPRERVPIVDAERYPLLRLTPWEQYAAAAQGAPLPLLGLLATTAGLAALSRAAFGRLVDSPSGSRPRGRRSEARFLAPPGLSPPAAAVATATFRLLLRSVRGRMMLFSAPLPVLMIGLVWKRFGLLATPEAPGGVVMVVLGGFMGLVSMQAFLSDQFAVDRAGLTLTFLTPVSDRDLVLGKAAAGLAALAIPLGFSTLAGVVLLPTGSPALWIAALVAVGGAYVLQAPVAALLAAMLPAPFDLMKLKGGNGHPLGTIVSMFMTLVALALVGGPGALALLISGKAWIALAATLAAATLATRIALLLFPAAARAVSLRRENLALIAQGR